MADLGVGNGNVRFQGQSGPKARLGWTSARDPKRTFRRMTSR